LVIDVGGVGYKVFVPEPIALGASHSEELMLHTYLQVREDALNLFGFADVEELTMFELLLSVNGVGPKVALSTLSVLSPDMLRMAVSAEEPAMIARVPGVGKRTAEKIVLELKDKMKPGDAAASGILRGDQEALEAMRALGYSASEARDALRQIPNDIESGSDRLRAALKLVGK
jgi:Holliday junction DNA helicase RuvA